MPYLPITVVIPTFNRAAVCLAALQSVYAQSMLPERVVVVDDGSREDMSPVKSLLAENRGLYIWQENRGVSAARNRGASGAETEWLAFLDSDDLWLPEKLERQFRLHLDNQDLVISQTRERWLRNGKEVRQSARQTPAQGECFARSLDMCCISASAVMIKRDVYTEVGGFDEGFPVCEDYDLWLKLTAKYSVGLVDLPLVIKNRGRDDQLSESVHALDRFRVQALVSALRRELSKVQRTMAESVLDKKLSILEKGAHKRNLAADLRHYHQIRQSYLNTLSITEIQNPT